MFVYNPSHKLFWINTFVDKSLVEIFFLKNCIFIANSKFSYIFGKSLHTKKKTHMKERVENFQIVAKWKLNIHICVLVDVF